MSSTYYVDSQREIILVRPTGHFTEDAFLNLCRALYNDPERHPRFSAVWDTRDIDELVMDADVIPRYKAFLRENEHRATEGQVAIITNRDIATIFASMLIQVDRKRMDSFETFSTLEAAAQWLDVPTAVLTNQSNPRHVGA